MNSVSGFVAADECWLSTLPRIPSRTGLNGPLCLAVNGCAVRVGTPATFGKAPGAEDYPVWTGLDVVTVYDERYSDLVVHEGSTPLIRHELSEEWQVMGWAHGDNVIYDGMGHDARSYSSPSHRKFLINEVDWLLS